jgi:ABC-type sugar transport system ATPase subunit
MTNEEIEKKIQAIEQELSLFHLDQMKKNVKFERADNSTIFFQRKEINKEINKVVEPKKSKWSLW